MVKYAQTPSLWDRLTPYVPYLQTAGIGAGVGALGGAGIGAWWGRGDLKKALKSALVGMVAGAIVGPALYAGYRSFFPGEKTPIERVPPPKPPASAPFAQPEAPDAAQFDQPEAPDAAQFVQPEAPAAAQYDQPEAPVSEPPRPRRIPKDTVRILDTGIIITRDLALKLIHNNLDARALWEAWNRPTDFHSLERILRMQGWQYTVGVPPPGRTYHVIGTPFF